VRAICFDRVAVQNHGVPVNMGRSFLTVAMTAADEVLTVNSASPFCQDMVPFKLDIDPTGNLETVGVKGFSGKNFTVQRGIDGTTPVAHGTAAVVAARFGFTGWDVSATYGSTGRVYWGKKDLVAGTAGVIYEIMPNSTGAQSDHREFMSNDSQGNPLNLSDYGTDDQVDGEGPNVVLWVR
jgi:hypothetical protein